MYKTSEPSVNRHDSLSTSRQTRLILMLAALCCLSVGAAVGAVVNGLAGAKSDDNRLTINSSALTPDALSVTFARVAREVEPCVAHIKVYESEVYGREGSGSGVIVNSTG